MLRGLLETLDQVARMGESLRVPFLLGMAPAFWGVRRASLLASLPDLVKKGRGGEYAKWKRFRATEASLWVAVAANRFLLRPPWGDDEAPVRGFSWAAGEAPAREPLWGSAVWALAATLLGAFTAYNICLTLSTRFAKRVCRRTSELFSRRRKRTLKCREARKFSICVRTIIWDWLMIPGW